MEQTPFLSEISLILCEYNIYVCQLSYPKVVKYFRHLSKESEQALAIWKR